MPLALVVGLVALLALWTAPAPQAAPPERMPDGPRYAADTLRYTARAGQAFIAGLPAQVGGAAATYRPLELPALSWLVDRSFFWNVQPGESGTLPVVFERTIGGSPAEPLVLLVEITR